MTKPATLRYYFDADILGLGKLVSRERSDCTYPGDPGATIHKRARPRCVITTPDTPDPEWIAKVTDAGMAIITRDAAIQRSIAEINAVRAAKARMFAFVGEEAIGTWNQLEILMIRWRKLEELAAEKPGPYIYRMSRTRMHPLNMD